MRFFIVLIMKKETYFPEWINEKDAAEWLNVHRNTLNKWRIEKGLHFTHINKRHIMYDKKQLIQILNENSTYKAAGLL